MEIYRKPQYHWHLVPKWLHWLCILFASFSWAFQYSVRIGDSRFIFGIDYDLFFFSLYEIYDGRWYFTWI